MSASLFWFESVLLIMGGPPSIIPRARLQTFSAKNQSIDARELVTVVRSQAIRPRGLSLKGRAPRF